MDKKTIKLIDKAMNEAKGKLIDKGSFAKYVKKKPAVTPA